MSCKLFIKNKFVNAMIEGGDLSTHNFVDALKLWTIAENRKIKLKNCKFNIVILFSCLFELLFKQKKWCPVMLILTGTCSLYFIYIKKLKISLKLKTSHCFWPNELFSLIDFQT